MTFPAAAVLRATGRQYIRQPANIALLLVLPPLFVLAFASALSTFSNVLGGNLNESAGAGLGALWAAALLSGSASYFLLSASRRADERLLIAGLSPVTLDAAHALGGAALAAVAGTVGFAIVVATQDVASPLDLWLAIMLGALAYEALGITLASFVRGDLEGSFLIILVFMFDAFVAGPLGGATGGWPNLFPLHHPSQIVVDAVLHGNVNRTRYLWGLGYTAALMAISVTTHARKLK